MNVLYIHQYFSTPEGASGTRSYEFAKALLAKGHRVTMICGSHAMSQTGLSTPIKKGLRRGMVEGIDVIEIVIPFSNYDGLIKRSFKFLQFAWRSIQLVFKEKFDVLFATSTPLTVAIPGILLKWIKPKKVFVFEVRDSWPKLPKALGVITNPLILCMLTWLERRAYFAADQLIGLSPGIVEHIESLVKNKPVEMIPNGCDLSFFQQESEVIAWDGIKETDFIVIFAGAHGIANGLDAVLNVAKIIANMPSDAARIKFLFVGDGKLKPELCKRAKDESLDNCIFFPPMPKEELRHLLKRANLGLMVLANVPAFYYGTSPNKFFDYIASGLPVINNYPGWVADLIQSHACGVVVSPNDAEGFARVLMELSSEASFDQNQQMAEQTYLLAADFDRIKLAERFVSCLELAHKEKEPMRAQA